MLCRLATEPFESVQLWSAAYEQLSKHAAAASRELAHIVNEQFSQTGCIPWFPDTPLDLSLLPAGSQPTLLEAVSDSSRNAAHSNSLQLTAEAMQQFRRMWDCRDVTPAVFVIVEKEAGAGGFFQQLKLQDRCKAAMPYLLETAPKPVLWVGGRVAYIGAVLRIESQILAVQKLLQPVIEPVLSLLLCVHWGGAPLDMTIQMFMRNPGNPQVRTASECLTRQWYIEILFAIPQELADARHTMYMAMLQVRLSSSNNNKRCQVKHLIEDIAAELRNRFGVSLDSAHMPRLDHICLQRDEGAEEIKDSQVCVVNSALVDYRFKCLLSSLHVHQTHDKLTQAYSDANIRLLYSTDLTACLRQCILACMWTHVLCRLARATTEVSA